MSQYTHNTSEQSWWQVLLLKAWYGKHWWAYTLLPLSWFYQILFSWVSNQHKKQAVKLPVPLVVVGNITVGGTGKTPVLIALAKALTQQHVAVGIISRGYGSCAPSYPYLVSESESNPSHSGDEPLLIARSTQCPVVIDKNRVAAAKLLLEQYPQTAIILSDDGLQHYRLARDVEIVVVDGQRGLGNHLCLPAGPLRESAKRLASVDWILRNTEASSLNNGEVTDKALHTISVKPVAWRNLSTGQCYPLTPLPWQNNASDKVIAMAGIGNPQRFFNTLESLNIHCPTYAFDDHYLFSAEDFSRWQDSTVLMTEKDAVKCQAFAGKNSWSLVVDMELPEVLINHISQLLTPQSSGASSLTR